MKSLIHIMFLMIVSLFIQAVYAQDSGIVGCQGGVCAGPSWDPGWYISSGAGRQAPPPSASPSAPMAGSVGSSNSWKKF